MNRRGARLAVGIGCRTGVAGPAAAALIERALAAARALPEAAGFAPGAAVFTAVEKRAETGLVEAAARLGLALVFLPRNALEAVSDGTVTRSERVVQLFGVPSIAETAALAGAGPGARLIVPRMASDGITCAVAVADGRGG